MGKLNRYCAPFVLATMGGLSLGACSTDATEAHPVYKYTTSVSTRGGHSLATNTGAFALEGDAVVVSGQRHYEVTAVAGDPCWRVRRVDADRPNGEALGVVWPDGSSLAGNKLVLPDDRTVGQGDRVTLEFIEASRDDVEDTLAEGQRLPCKGKRFLVETNRSVTSK